MYYLMIDITIYDIIKKKKNCFKLFQYNIISIVRMLISFAFFPLILYNIILAKKNVSCFLGTEYTNFISHIFIFSHHFFI